jgi:hypothetical protein
VVLAHEGDRDVHVLTHGMKQLRKPIAYLFDEGSASVPDTLETSARRWRDFVSFVHVDANDNPELLSALDLLADGGLPALSVEGVINDQVYPMPQDWDMDSDNVNSFLQGILEGKARGGRDGMSWLQESGLVGSKKEMVKDEL